MKTFRLGYGYFNHTLKNYNTNNVKLKTFESKGFDYVKSIVKNNCRNLIKIMRWNYKNKIYFYRISNNLIPQLGNKLLYDINGKEAHYYQKLNWLDKELEEVSKAIKKYQQRLTLHTSLYNHLASRNTEIVINTTNNLYHMSRLLDLLDCDKDSVMILHIGGVYKNKEQTIERWKFNYVNYLCDNTKKRLVIENCQDNYCIEDCLNISQEVNIPVVFDIFHHQIYNKQKLLSAEHYLEDVLLTWNRKNIRPKFHLSEQGNGKRGKHSDYIENIPDYLLRKNLDIMLEARMGEQNLLKLKKKYYL